MESVVIDVDARGLVPPQPLVRIMEVLPRIAGGGEIRALTDRRPIHLYPLLELRGYRSETSEAPDHGFLTVIRARS